MWVNYTGCKAKAFPPPRDVLIPGGGVEEGKPKQWLSFCLQPSLEKHPVTPNILLSNHFIGEDPENLPSDARVLLLNNIRHCWRPRVRCGSDSRFVFLLHVHPKARLAFGHLLPQPSWGPFQHCRLLLGLLLHFFCFAYLCHFWRPRCTLPLISGWKTRPMSLKGALIHSKCAGHVAGHGEHWQCCNHSLCCSRAAKSLVDAAGASCASHHLSPLGTALETWGGVLLLICWFF